MTDALLDRLAGTVAAAGSRLMVAGSYADVIGDVVGEADAVAVSPRLAASATRLVGLLDAAGVRVIVPHGERAVGEVADADVGVVRGELAVAETGSVLVDEHDIADRSTSMLTRRAVQIVPAARVVADLDDVAEWLRAHVGAAGFASLITGPSRSADIERSLTIGVQGPTHVDVIVHEEATW